MRTQPRNLVFICVIVLISACTTSPGTPTPGLTPLILTPTTQPPTATATEPAPLAILVAPPESDQTVLASLQPVLEELAATSGLAFVIQPSLSQEEIAGLPAKLVILLAPDPGAAQLAESLPQVQFLAVNIPDLIPAPNLSVVESTPYRPDMIGFIAGYLSAVVSEDWRAAVISEAGSVPGKASRNGFDNGFAFFCGLCQPVYPPYPMRGYPLFWELSPGAPQTEVDGALAYFNEWKVKTVFIQPAEDGLLSTLGQSGYNLIAARVPPDGISTQWLASILPGDLSQTIRNLWPDLLQGQGGQRVYLSMSITHVNGELVSPGRQTYVNNLLADMAAGLVDPGVDLATGEMR